MPVLWNKSALPSNDEVLQATNDVERLRHLLAQGASANAKDILGNTALHVAVDSPLAVAMLLAAGANPNACCRTQETPLHRAAAYGQWESVQALLAAGADPYAPDDGNHTALEVALRGGLVERLAGINGAHEYRALRVARHRTLDRWLAARPDAYGLSAQVLFDRVLDQVMAVDRAGGVAILAKHGHFPTTPYGGQPWLLCALSSNCVEPLEALLAAGADPNAPGPNGETAMIAVVTRKKSLDLLREFSQVLCRYAGLWTQDCETAACRTYGADSPAAKWVRAELDRQSLSRIRVPEEPARSRLRL